MPNNLDLDAIRARAAAATPAPWYWGPEHPEFSDVFGEADLVLPGDTPLMQFEPDRNGAADAEFVAYARQDVPALIDALGRAFAVIRQNAITQTNQSQKIAELNQRITEAHEALAIEEFDGDSCPDLEATIDYAINRYREVCKSEADAADRVQELRIQLNQFRAVTRPKVAEAPRVCGLCDKPFGPEDVEATPPGTEDVVHVCCWYGGCDHPRTTSAPKSSGGGS